MITLTKKFGETSTNYLNFFSNCSDKWICDFCGDEIAVDFLCDLPLGNVYDGCDDFCEVENKFSCTVLPLTKRTECAYLERLSLTLVNISKHSSPNVHQITLTVAPPLHILSMLTFSEIKLLFALPPKFTTTSIAYNSTTGLLFIEFVIDDDLSTGPFYIDFDPSSVGIDHHFAIKPQRLELT